MSFLRSFVPPVGTAAHLVAIAIFGLMAGFFGTYSINVAPALMELDGPLYATVQSALNRHVRHWLFFVCFFGPVACAALALACAGGQWRRGWWRLLAIAALAYLLGIVFFTREINLPLNRLTESWPTDQVPPGWAQVRDQWNTANLWRSVVSLWAFGLGLASLCWRRPARA